MLAPFSEISKTFPEPWNTLVLHFGERFHQDYFENFILEGEKPGNDQLEPKAYWIFGLAPNIPATLECRAMEGKTEIEREAWSSRFKEILPLLAKDIGLELLGEPFVVARLRRQLGENNTHLVGMIAIYKTVPTGKEIVSLWKHPRIDRVVAEFIMAKAMAKRVS